MANQLVAATERLPHYTRASSSLLAAEPADKIDFEVKSGLKVRKWKALVQHLEARLAMLRNWRISWWEHWALLAAYILPRRYHWLINPAMQTRGLPINQDIVDPTGTQAMRVCAAGLMSGLTSPSRPWFKLKPAMEGLELDHDAQLWFDGVENRLYAVMSGSNFYDSMAQMFEDLVVFGTAPVIIYEDAKELIRCFNPCAGEYFLGVNGSFRVDTFYRQFTMTVEQMVSWFGLKNCPPDVQEAWRNKAASLEVERIVAHAIEPNYGVEAGGIVVDPVPGRFAYREYYWLWGASGEYPFSERGFHEVPFICPRWATTSNDAYGRSPAMDALQDIIQLQVETRRKGQAIEKQVNPPLLASVELKNQPSSTLPGNITYSQSIGADKGMRPVYEVQPELDNMTADLKEIQDRIKRGFFNDLFLMMAEQTKEMTAYEVAQRQQEKLQVLGPVIEKAQNEALSPAIKRILNIMVRAGLLPPPPQSLARVPLQIEYISMLSLAQKAAATGGIERLLAVTGNMMQVWPQVADNIDPDELVTEYADDVLVPHKIMRGAKQVEQLRQDRAQAEQQQKQAAQMAAMAQPAKDASQAAMNLSQTDVGGGNNALQAILGGTAGSGAVGLNGNTQPPAINPPIQPVRGAPKPPPRIAKRA